jgi:prepilin-type N-terminal cleavage/methylation domain-containing protein
MNRHNRRAFTLIEMLVVIGILTVIATLSVLIIPRVNQRAKAARGGERLVGWLLEARGRAQRDGEPRGVRLLFGSSGGAISTAGAVTDAVFIGRPDPFTGGLLTFTSTNSVSITGVDLSGGQAATAPDLWPVQAGDFLQVQGGPSYLISGVTAGVGTPPVSTVTTANLMYSAGPPNPTSNYVIIRGARPLPGEEPLSLPDDVIVDATKSMPIIPVPLVGQVPTLYYDILFTPAGTVTGSLGDSNGKIILWVRDASQDPDQPGEQPLIVIYTRSGAVAAVPSNPQNPTNPYQFVTDPRNSGT